MLETLANMGVALKAEKYVVLRYIVTVYWLCYCI